MGTPTRGVRARPFARLVPSVLAGVALLLAQGCLALSACSGEIASAGGCPEACEGIPVSRTERCLWSGERLSWCVEPRPAPENIPCVTDTATGTFFRSQGYPREMPDGFRFCTAEEEALLSDFSGCD